MNENPYKTPESQRDAGQVEVSDRAQGKLAKLRKGRQVLWLGSAIFAADTISKEIGVFQRGYIPLWLDVVLIACLVAWAIFYSFRIWKLERQIAQGRET